jgi:hypothetical protein
MLLVVEHNGPTMMARIGIMRALNRHVERVFNPARKHPNAAINGTASTVRIFFRTVISIVKSEALGTSDFHEISRPMLSPIFIRSLPRHSLVTD